MQFSGIQTFTIAQCQLHQCPISVFMIQFTRRDTWVYHQIMWKDIARDRGSPITHAKKLKGNLLIVHGTGDDNCHYAGTETLINELIQHNKPFSMMAYPNRSHSISEGSNTTRHLFSTLTNFLTKNVPKDPVEAVVNRESKIQ